MHIHAHALGYYVAEIHKQKRILTHTSPIITPPNNMCEKMNESRTVQCSDHDTNPNAHFSRYVASVQAKQARFRSSEF